MTLPPSEGPTLASRYGVSRSRAGELWTVGQATFSPVDELDEDELDEDEVDEDEESDDVPDADEPVLDELSDFAGSFGTLLLDEDDLEERLSVL
ncbi:MAG TPA: hypothetical protein VFJ21_02150 [Mycobacteriales bacterium]|jgi:hypothetical protein|nr:hypothetical protein [Mycobacteriales bacterium]